MRPMIRILFVWLIAAALLLGCAGPSATEAPPTGAPPAAAPTPMPPPLPTPTEAAPPVVAATAAPLPVEGALAPDFAFTLFQGEDTLGGRELWLSDLRGKPLALNFWARLCTPCWSEMPELQDFYQEYGEQVWLLGIDVGQFTGLGSHKDAGKLLDALGITYPAGFTDDAKAVSSYRIEAMPTTVFISSEGHVFRKWTGSIDRETAAAIVQEMLDGD